MSATAITLRADQDDLRGKLRVALRSNTSVLAFAPTGFGKTVLASALMKALFEKDKRVAFCVHRVDLITQTAKTLNKFGVPYSFIASGHHYNPLHRVYIASIATLKNRLDRIKLDYLFVDEAHLSMAAGWKTVVDHYRKAGAKIIGLTGTPKRLDGKPLGDAWDTMVMGPSVSWLIEHGHLSTYRAYAPKGIDYSGVKVRKGEMVAAEVEALENGKAIISDAIGKWRKYADGLRTIAFCRSVERAEEFAAQFTAAGIPSVALDGETPQHIRKQAFIDFAIGKVMVIFNCALFCEGFDLAAQIDRDVTIECVMQLAPTASLARHLQQLGRALRKKDYAAVLLDLVGNIARHGLPDDDRDWSLDGDDEAKPPKLVDCQHCGAAVHRAPKCSACGEPMGSGAGAGQEREDLKQVDVEVEEIDQKARRAAMRQQEEAGCMSLRDLVALGQRRGYKMPMEWAGKVWTTRQAQRRKGVA